MKFFFTLGAAANLSFAAYNTLTGVEPIFVAFSVFVGVLLALEVIGRAP